MYCFIESFLRISRTLENFQVKKIIVEGVIRTLFTSLLVAMYLLSGSSTTTKAAGHRRDVLLIENYLPSTVSRDEVLRTVAKLIQEAKAKRIRVDLLKMENRYVETVILGEEILAFPWQAPEMMRAPMEPPPPSINGRMLRLFSDSRSVPAKPLQGLADLSRPYTKRLGRLVFITSAIPEEEGASASEQGIVFGLKNAERTVLHILTVGEVDCSKWTERGAFCMPLNERSLRQSLGF